jgi:hypothetical protein
MFQLLTIGALVASSIIGGPISSDPVPPPATKVVIDLVSVNGSGCPAGTAAIALAQDNTAFTVTYSKFLAQVGVGATSTDWRKNCQLNVLVHVPQGFTYAVAQADYRGFAHLEKGASALQRANYYFGGTSPTSYINHPLAGPFEDDWHNTDVTDLIATSFAPCGEQRNLNINTELRVDGGTSNLTKTNSFITMDSADTSISTTYHFAWKQCPTA